MKIILEQKNKAKAKNAELDSLRQAVEYVRTHRENSLIALGVVAALVILVPLYFQKRASNFEKAQDLLTLGGAYTRQPVIKTDSKFNFAGNQYFHSKEEKYKKATETFQQILNLYPSSPAAGDAVFNLALCSFELKKYDEALDSFQSYLNKYPKGKYKYQALLGTAYCYEQKKDYRKAIDILEQTRNFEGGAKLWKAEALYHEGLCLLNSGEKAKAKQTLEQVSKEYPGTIWDNQAREIL